jgi:hypothetical protein
VSAAAAAADPSCPSCLPDPKPDDKKDFIIDVRTRETSGKKKFRLNDNARIIVKEMNPFLYEYRVTLKDKPIVESAIATFFSGWPLFADQFENPEDKADSKAKMAASESVACDQLDRQYGTAVGRIRQLIAELSSAAAQIGRDYTRQKEAYEPVAQKIETDKKVLYDENANCSDVCRTATSIRSTLQQYKPDLEDLSKRISNFKLDADLLQRRVEELKELIENNPRPNPNLPPVTGPQCDEVISGFEVLAKGYVTTASGLESGIKKITSGKKMFDAIVKTINDVLSNPNAFYKVYTRGEYSLPTDVEITVERKDLTKENATFVKIVDAETINFGGGPRFAVAGGVVVSPLETINFKRVPALINGQQTTIVGQDESSNSRILPILMLHGRFLEGKGPISGFHFSLGVTAKPTDSGTNVEFLLGPSISFIEERLFFTFGGYAGRRKQLEGNLVPGQELPKDFSDEIPTSNHLVWKPGIALTYKFK